MQAIFMRFGDGTGDPDRSGTKQAKKGNLMTGGKRLFDLGKTPVTRRGALKGLAAGAAFAAAPGFVRYALGEGIEKQESDFAAEVAAAAGTN